MRNNSHTCPSGLSLISSPKRLCDGTSSGCVSNSFSVQDVQYSHVCGKIIGYQNRLPVAFHHSSRGIDGDYVYGVSLTRTHGQSPRKHIWTFAGAPDETVNDVYSYKCPCINTALPRVSSYIPSFVGMITSVTLPSVYTGLVFLMLCNLLTLSGMEGCVVPLTLAVPSTPLHGLLKTSPPLLLMVWR